jgi:hypothetical protein
MLISRLLASGRGALVGKCSETNPGSGRSSVDSIGVRCQVERKKCNAEIKELFEYHFEFVQKPFFDQKQLIELSPLSMAGKTSPSGGSFAKCGSNCNRCRQSEAEDLNGLYQQSAVIKVQAEVDAAGRSLTGAILCFFNHMKLK